MVPLVSEELKGRTSGAKHVGRLLFKLLLELKGRLAKGYPAIGAGFDAALLGAAGNTSAEEARAWVKEAVTKYKSNQLFEEFDKWLVGKGLTGRAVTKLNAIIDGYPHGDETIAEIETTAGLPKGQPLVRAVDLNPEEDFALAVEEVVSGVESVPDPATA